jgi:peroxiredoxin Q/BCP
MPEIKIGDKAPDFNLPGDGGTEVRLADYRGRRVILYFYPKDDTPGCTAESCDFRDNLKALERLNSAVIGISKDSVQKHEKFKAKYKLNFPLASDESDTVCERYGVWTEKSMYGKKYMGIERSTFLIDEKGKIAALWRKVKVRGHVEEIRKTLEEFAKTA